MSRANPRIDANIYTLLWITTNTCATINVCALLQTSTNIVYDYLYTRIAMYKYQYELSHQDDPHLLAVTLSLKAFLKRPVGDHDCQKYSIYIHKYQRAGPPSSSRQASMSIDQYLLHMDLRHLYLRLQYFMQILMHTSANIIWIPNPYASIYEYLLWIPNPYAYIYEYLFWIPIHVFDLRLILGCLWMSLYICLSISKKKSAYAVPPAFP